MFGRAVAAVGLKKSPRVSPTEQGPRSERGWDPFLGRSSGWEGLARREAVSAGRGRSGRPGEQEPQSPEHRETWVQAARDLGSGRARLRFSHLFLTADSNLRTRQVRLVELHPAGQPRPERPGHRPRAGPWPQLKGQDVSHAQR